MRFFKELLRKREQIYTESEPKQTPGFDRGFGQIECLPFRNVSHPRLSRDVPHPVKGVHVRPYAWLSIRPVSYVPPASERPPP